MRWKDR